MQKSELIQFIKKLAKKNNALLAVLFGSFARQTDTKHSDIDVMFVEETTERFVDRIGKYHHALVDNFKMPVDVLVYTPAEYLEMQEKPFMKKIMKEGVVIFESGKIQRRCSKVA